MNNRLSTTCYIVAIVTTVIFGASCKKTLETAPLDKFDQATFWTSETNANLALAAVYRGDIFANNAEYTVFDWWDHNGLIWLDMATDNAYDRRLENSVNNKLTNGTNTANNAILLAYWTHSYARIARCNDFLENIGKVPMADITKKRMIAETRFIRACQYYYMAQFWGSVPLVIKTLTLNEANNVTKAPHADLVKFVIDEFTQAVTDVPRFKELIASETGRVSKQAVLAFLGRMQMAEGLYTNAATTYQTIIGYNENSIDPNYTTIFLESNENSSENIFSTQFVPNLLSNGIMAHIAPSMMGGFDVMNPLASLMEAYQFTDGTPFSYTDPRYDYKDIGKNRDPRLKYTILYDKAPFRGSMFISHPDSANSPDQIQSPVKQTTQTGYAVKKYVDENFGGNLSTGYGGNMPIIRYAEVLLTYLEARLEGGEAITQPLLDLTINKVRSRATVNMPPITQTNPALLRTILRNERRVEFALEGTRLLDLLRWKIADQVLKGDFYGHPYPVSTRALRKKNATAAADPYKRWYITTKNFRKGIDEYWPVPQAEVNINPKLQ